MFAKYSEIRPTIRTGDLLAWNITSPSDMGDLFLYSYQKIFNIKYSHVGIAAVLGGRLFVVEAIPPVVRLYPISRKSNFYLIPCNIDEKPGYLEYLFNDLGKDYSLLDLFKTCIGLKASDKDFYCSELAGDFYKFVGLLDSEKYGKMPHILVDQVIKVTGKEPLLVVVDKGGI